MRDGLKREGACGERALGDWWFELTMVLDTVSKTPDFKIPGAPCARNHTVAKSRAYLKLLGISSETYLNISKRI